MWELVALILYSVQWLGIVLGVGAEAVLLVGHLAARHAHQPDWLANIPAVRVVQRWGLVFIIFSGIGAVLYQLANDSSVLFIPTFGFKWLLIVLCAAAFLAEGLRRRGSGALEGFAGATWLALFVVHSVAPIFMWIDLIFFYAIWLALFFGTWSLAVWAMGRHSPPSGMRPAAVNFVPAPARVAPSPAAVKVEPPIAASESAGDTYPSLWQRFANLFDREGAPAEPVHSAPVTVRPQAVLPDLAPMARASAPIHMQSAALTVRPTAAPPAPTPAPFLAPAPVVPAAPLATNTHLPVVEYLEIAAPAAPIVVAPAPAPVAQQVPESGYVPDYRSLPGVRIMPQRPEDLLHESRAPIVQTA